MSPDHTPAPGLGWSRAQVADALWEGLLSPREAAVFFPDMLATAALVGLDPDTRVNLDALLEDADEDADHPTATTATAPAEGDGVDEGWGS